MSLLGGGLARIFGAAFGATYLPATLHARTAVTYDAGGSVVTPEGFQDLTCRAQLESRGEGMNAGDGFVDGAQRIFILSASLASAPTTRDQITVSGGRYQIIAIDRDPAGAYWDVQGRRA